MFNIDPHKQEQKKEIGKSGVEAEFVKTIKQAGGKAYKFTSEMNRGVSDRLVVFPGQIWFVEIKRDKGKLTPLQEDFERHIKSLNLNHFVVYGIKGIQEFMEKVK